MLTYWAVHSMLTYWEVHTMVGGVAGGSPPPITPRLNSRLAPLTITLTLTICDTNPRNSLRSTSHLQLWRWARFWTHGLILTLAILSIKIPIIIWWCDLNLPADMTWGRCRNPKLTKDRVHSFEFQCYPCFSIALRFSAITFSDVVDCIDLHLSP